MMILLIILFIHLDTMHKHLCVNNPVFLYTAQILFIHYSIIL